MRKTKEEEECLMFSDWQTMMMMMTIQRNMEHGHRGNHDAMRVMHDGSNRFAGPLFPTFRRF